MRLQKAGELTDDGQKLLEKAAEFLNANLDRDPDNADAQYNLAITYALAHDELRAQAHMTVACRMKQTLEPPSEWLLP